MASLIYNSLLEDIATGAVDLNTDTFKAMLVTDSYTADKDASVAAMFSRARRRNVVAEWVPTR